MTDRDEGERPPALIDPRPGQLLERYAALCGGLLMELGDGLHEFEIPASERKHWGREKVVRLALTPEALDEDLTAELMGLGTPAFERLVTAIRARGVLETGGLIAPEVALTSDAPAFPLALEGAQATRPDVVLSLLPIGRILARVSIKSGHRLQERLVESPLVDLASGAVLPAPLAASLERALSTTHAGLMAPPGAVVVDRRAAEQIIPQLFEDLQRTLADELERMAAEAQRATVVEVQRIEGYYGAMLDDVTPMSTGAETAAAKRVIRAELERRRSEEEVRNQIRVTVHPLQVVEWRVAVQRATWRVTAPSGHTGEIAAQRYLLGEAPWEMACPTCSRAATAVRVCAHGHACCTTCSEACDVCGDTCCEQHGLSRCTSGAHAVCGTHARTCDACGNGRCTTHAARCTFGDHDVCPACALSCGRCGTAICRTHATSTAASAPLGARWLCESCTVLCEGGSNEPVGLDEVAACSSCERHICTNHRVTCAVDGRPHCSRHLRRSDCSGRLVCDQHRATCADEAHAVFASDEVWGCTTCARPVCDAHSGLCHADGARHCTSHLVRIADVAGQCACMAHHVVCHVDKIAFSMAGTTDCPVCGKATCKQHLTADCTNCGRRVCVRDVSEGRCVTCRRLKDTDDPADELLHAAISANGGESPKPKAWRVARDAAGRVVELDLGWTRRLVFALPDGFTEATSVVRHSVMGSRKER